MTTQRHQRTSLIDRVRAMLPGEPREVRMFGGISFMIDDAMVLAVSADDSSLLVRLDPSRDAQLTAQPHAARAEMGPGRTMGPGWIRISSAGVAEPADLERWINESLTS